MLNPLSEIVERLGRRSQETDATEAGSVVVLTAERAVSEWKRLEPEKMDGQHQDR